jgi:hypothetical protein
MAKQRANKVPKRIAGVKVPKAIRKGPVGDFLGSSGGQVLLAELLLALGAVYAARRLDSNGDALRQSRDRLRAGRDWSRDASERIAHAIRAGLHAFRAALHEPSAGAGAAAPELGATPVGEGEATRKKSSSRREQPPRDAPATPH